MALVTLQRSPTPSAASSSASASELEVRSEEEGRLGLSLSESFFMVKGAALFLQQENSPQGPRNLPHPHKHAGDLPQHLQVMINLLRCEDRIKLAVCLESVWSDRVRYMVVVYSNGRQDTEENILLGVDFSSKESQSCTIGMVLRLWSDTKIHLDGDGGFSISTAGKMHVFKPVSVQAMWSALQILHKACEVARRYNYFPGGTALVWATYYESCIASDQSCINEWNAMQDLESTRPDSPVLYVDKPTKRERAEWLIKAKLRSIMMSKDLENVTSKDIRNELEKQMSCHLKEFKEFIDNEMLLILGQMDKPSLIFDHLYLGSEWNASNLEELQSSGVDYILNVTREIDNFFPGLFAYHNIRVYDEETTDLLAHWNETYHFINKAKRNRSKCLVHCKMGVSRSASTVIAYAMKEFGWSLEKAYGYIKEKRSIAQPNAGFMRQLQEYQGILDASKQRHNKLWKQEKGHGLPPSSDASTSLSDFLFDSLEMDLEPLCLPAGADPQTTAELQGFGHGSRPLSGPLPGMQELPFQAEKRELMLEEAADSVAGELPFAGFSSQLEEEEPAVKETVRMSGLGGHRNQREPEEGLLKEGMVPGPLVSGEEKSLERWGPRSLEEMNWRNGENHNNNNSKRSCPEDFERNAIFGVLNKVKPSYKSCADCMYPSLGGSSEPLGDSGESPQPGPPCHSTTVCTQPSFLPRGATVLWELSFSRSLEASQEPKTNRWLSGPTTNEMYDVREERPAIGCRCGTSGKPRENRQSPEGALFALRNPLPEQSPVFNKLKHESVPRRDARQTKNLKGLLFGRDLEKPTSNSCLIQRQESLLQLQKAGLVRKHTEELERLRNVQPDAAGQGKGLLGSTILEEELQEMVPPPRQGPSSEDVESNAEKPWKTPLAGDPSQKTSTPVASFSRDFLKTLSCTPPSSRSSNLTRSSSSDSIHSVRGKPGLVQQRTQEIETRLRLAGLTVSTPLKRSNSLAKLSRLDLDSEDLAGEVDLAFSAERREAVPKEPPTHGGFLSRDASVQVPSPSFNGFPLNGSMEDVAFQLQFVAGNACNRNVDQDSGCQSLPIAY